MDDQEYELSPEVMDLREQIANAIRDFNDDNAVKNQYGEDYNLFVDSHNCNSGGLKIGEGGN